jgi:adenylate cyclase
VDAVGYSRRSEIDETLAVREIAALGERVSECAAAHGGRVFNTAGDGFMLEFSTASGALECAETLLANTRVPLRIGIHLGEVSEMQGGDLLGRGVNVAARLRELAPAGALLVSGEVKRALPAPGGERLTSHGMTKLSKMDERVEMFAIAGTWKNQSALDGFRRPRAWLVASLVVVAVAVAGLFVPDVMRQDSEGVAVLNFKAAGDTALTSFATGLSDQIVNALSASALQAIPPGSSDAFRSEGLGVAAKRIGAGFALDGGIRRESDMLNVSMHIVDARTNATLWSNEYRRAASESAYMQEQLATHVADVLRCALVSRRPRAGQIDPETLSIFLRACDRMQRYDQGPEILYEAARQVTERAPRFSRGWSMLGMAYAVASLRAPPDRAEDFRRQAREAALKAKSLDNRNAESDLALSLVVAPSDWMSRQSLIDNALASEPDSPDANLFKGNFLIEVGRVIEALGYYRRAVALDPLSPVSWAAMLPALSQAREDSEARQLRERLGKIWPDSPSVWFNRFNGAAFSRRADEALAILDTVDVSPIRMEQPVRAAWRDYLTAMRVNDEQGMRAVAKRLAEFSRTGAFDMPRSISLASLAGDVEAGFTIAGEYFGGDTAAGLGRAPIAGGTRSFLFLRPGEAMRRDPRFIPLVKTLGLTAYWTSTEQWPDFCSDPALPYNCKAKVAELGE